MKEIQLTKGKVALVDDKDYDRVMAYGPWQFDSHSGYAKMRLGVSSVYLHRFIMNPPDHLQVDHKYHNKLDCRRKHLRVVSRAINQLNRKLPSKGTVVKTKNGRFRAQLSVGTFDTKLQAYEALQYFIALRLKFHANN